MALFGNRVLCFIILLTTAALSELSIAVAQTPPDGPKPLEVYRGKAAALDMSVPKNREFRTRLRAALKEPPNFAGHYVLTLWGCGTRCQTGAAVDLLTGKVVFLGFTVCCWPDDVKEAPFRFEATSSRLIVAGQLNEGGATEVHFFEFKNGAFEKLGTVGDVVAVFAAPAARDRERPNAPPSSTAPPPLSYSELQSNSTLASEDRLFELSVCNRTNTKIYVILLRRHWNADDKWQLDGWHAADPGACVIRKNPRGYFYISADGDDGRVWKGSDRYICTSKRATERVVFENERCVVGETNRGFKELFNVNDAFRYELR